MTPEELLWVLQHHTEEAQELERKSEEVLADFFKTMQVDVSKISVETEQSLSQQLSLMYNRIITAAFGGDSFVYIPE